MEIKVTIEAPVLADALIKLAEALNAPGRLEMALQAVEASTDLVVPDTGKRQKKAAQPKTEDTSPWTDETKEAEEKKDLPSIVDARRALAELSGKGKKTEAKKILSDLGCSQLSDVDPKEYSSIIEKCKEVA